MNNEQNDSIAELQKTTLKLKVENRKIHEKQVELEEYLVSHYTAQQKENAKLKSKLLKAEKENLKLKAELELLKLKKR